MCLTDRADKEMAVALLCEPQAGLPHALQVARRRGQCANSVQSPEDIGLCILSRPLAEGCGAWLHFSGRGSLKRAGPCPAL